MTLDQLRAHTISLVERKQAKADRRERLAEQARVAFLDTLPPSTAAALYSSGRGTRLSGTSAAAAMAALSTTNAAASVRPATSGASVRSGASVKGDGADRPATADVAGAGGGAPSAPVVPALVPKPPSQPSTRPAAARPGPRTVAVRS